MPCIKTYLAIGAMVLLAACGNPEGETGRTGPSAVPLGKSAKSEAFNQSFGKLLTGYYALKDGFVAENADTTLNRLANTMMIAADSLKLAELKTDSNLVANAGIYAGGISAELKGLAGETSLEGKRKSFQMVGNQLYDLVRMVQYDRAVIYRQYCPMAFNDQGADWLSSSPAIRNPYIPEKMQECGEIKDSIDFRPKM